MKTQNGAANHRKSILLLLSFGSILINGGLFPIYSFHPDSPDLGLVLPLLCFLVFLGFLRSEGETEALLFPKGRTAAIFLYNMGLLALGLFFRFLLEYGEVSNTYGFTVQNVLLHGAFAVLLPTLVFYSRRKRREREEKEN